MAGEVNRRDFLSTLGVSVGAALTASAGSVIPAVGVAHAQEKPKGNIPDTPYKIGHMTFFTGPAAVLGEPMFKGQQLAAEEINAAGGLLGRRKIELLKADEAAGTDANVKELRRLKLSEKIDFFCGITSSGNTPALGPVAEELKTLTIFVDGCTDFLWDKAVPNPHYIFRITNMQSADGVTCAVAVAQTWPKIKKIAHIHPDYSYGRNAFDHFGIVMKKLLPQTEVVSEGWPKLGTTDFSSHITKTIASKPDLIVASVWGGDYVAMYKQALRYGMFKKAKFASMIAFGVAPHAIGKDHPEGVIAGVHSNYHFTYPGGDRWPYNKSFVEKYHARFNEYPNFQAEGEGKQARRWLARRRGHHRDAGRPDDRRTRGLRLHPARQPPGLQGRGDGLQQERAGVSVPDPRPGADHHDPDSEHHGASGLAQGGADLHVHLDRQDLAGRPGLGITTGAGRQSPRPRRFSQP